MSVYLRKRDKKSTKQGYVWEIVYDNIVEGKRIRKYRRLPDNTNKKKAEEIVHEIELKTRFGSYISLYNEPMLLTTFLDELFVRNYITPQNLSPSTIRTHTNAIESKQYGLRRIFGKYYMNQIDINVLQEFVDDRLNSGIKVKTIKNQLGVLNVIFEDAKRRGVLPQDFQNPVKMVRYPRKDERQFEHEVYSLNEVDAMLKKACEEKDHILICLLALTCLAGGCRKKSELVPLRWSDFEREGKEYKTLILKRTAVLTTHNAVVIRDEGKTKNALRVIPIPSMVSYYLNVARKIQQEERFKTVNWIGEDYIFTMDSKYNGRLVKPNYLYNSFKRFVRKYSFPEHRLHDTRGTFATLSFEAGMNPMSVASIIGHSNPMFTYEKYAVISNDFKKKEMQKLDNVIKQVI